MLVSIIIPTKNRYDNLYITLKELIKFDSQDIEFVIQDNSEDNEEFIDFLKQINDRRVKYFHDTSFMNTATNSDLAVMNSEGEYICYIGDDDCVTDRIVDVAKLLKEKNIDACLTNMAHFFWKDCVFSGKPKPALYFDMSKKKADVIDPIKALNESMSWGMLDIKFLPRVYHAIIRRSLLIKVKEKCGSCFPGTVPDMANAVCETFITNRCIFSNLPLVLSGYSFHSAAGRGQRGDFSDKLDDEETIRKNALSPDVVNTWSERLPRIVDGYSLWTQTAIDGFLASGHQEYIDRINYCAMFAKSILKYKKNRSAYMEFIKNNNCKLRTYFEMIRFGFRYIKEQIVKKSKDLMHRFYNNYNRMEMSEACEIVNDYIDCNWDIFEKSIR